MILSLSSVIFEFLWWFIQILFPLLSYQSIRSFQFYRWFMKTFSSLRYVTSQSFSRRISSMQKSIACHQFNLMKDKHTINLILISSKWVIPSFGVRSCWINSSSKCFHLFFSGVQNFLGHFVGTSIYIIASFNLILSSFILSHHPFVTGVLHGGSSWINLFFKCSSRFL